MKRTDLEALGLEKEVIDKVMQLHGADIEAKKQQIATLQSNNDAQAQKIAELGENLKASEGDAQKIADLQKHLPTTTQALHVHTISSFSIFYHVQAMSP